MTSPIASAGRPPPPALLPHGLIPRIPFRYAYHAHIDAGRSDAARRADVCLDRPARDAQPATRRPAGHASAHRPFRLGAARGAAGGQSTARGRLGRLAVSSEGHSTARALRPARGARGRCVAIYGSSYQAVATGAWRAIEVTRAACACADARAARAIAIPDGGRPSIGVAVRDCGRAHGAQGATTRQRRTQLQHRIKASCDCIPARCRRDCVEISRATWRLGVGPQTTLMRRGGGDHVLLPRLKL